MRKKSIILMAILLIAAALLSGCAKETSTDPSKDTGKVYEMKISHLTSEIDPLHIGYEYLKESLDKKTDGRIKVTIYPNKSIANSDREQAEMVQNNLAQMGTAPAYTLAALNEELKEFFIYDYPYLMSDSKTLYDFADSEIGERMLSKLKDKTGIKGYPGFHIGWVKVSSNSKPILKPSDINNLKIRTTSSNMYMELMKAFGAYPTPISYGELFTALQQKTVDGMMTTTSLYVSDRFYEVQKYMGAIDPFTIFHYPMISGTWYDSLPEDLKTIFDECMYEYIDYMRVLEDEKEIKSINELREKGMEVIEYTDEEKQAFKDLGMPLNEQFKKIAGEDFVDEVLEFLGK